MDQMIPSQLRLYQDYGHSSKNHIIKPCMLYLMGIPYLDRGEGPPNIFNKGRVTLMLQPPRLSLYLLQNCQPCTDVAAKYIN